MALHHSPSIITNRLMLCLDAANIKSYPGTGTTWTDLSGNGYNATLVGSPSFTNGYFSLTGTQSATFNNDAANFGTSDFSTEFWYYYSGTQPNYGVLFDNGSQGMSIQFGTPTTNILFYSIPSNNDATGVPHNMTLNTWNHIVHTRSGGNLTIYINGVVKGTWTGKTGSFSPQSGSLAYIGTYSLSTGYAISGRISVFKIYKGYALTQTDVLQNFNALRGRYGI